VETTAADAAVASSARPRTTKTAKSSKRGLEPVDVFDLDLHGPTPPPFAFDDCELAVVERERVALSP
jgi:hypothetical protein